MIRSLACLILTAAIALTPLLGCGEDDEEKDGEHDHHGHHDSATTQTEALSNQGLYHVHWESTSGAIRVDEPFDMEILVHDGDHKPLSGEVTIAVDATMPAHGHGMHTAPTLSGGPTTFTASGMKLHMSGLWELVIEVDGPLGQDSAQMDIACCE